MIQKTMEWKSLILICREATTVKCTFTKDVSGFFILPFVGVIKRECGMWELWIGWFQYIFAWNFYSTKEYGETEC